jgi:hypothetical protein
MMCTVLGFVIYCSGCFAFRKQLVCFFFGLLPLSFIFYSFALLRLRGEGFADYPVCVAGLASCPQKRLSRVRYGVLPMFPKKRYGSKVEGAL